MERNALANALRLAMGATIVLAMIAAGVLHRSPAVVGLAVPVLTLLYAFGKWTAWSAAWRSGGSAAIVRAVLLTLPAQAVLAGVLYLLGLGLGKLLAPSSALAALSAIDIGTSVAVFVVGAAVSAVLLRLERHEPPPPATQRWQALPFEPDPTPIVPATFFVSPAGAPATEEAIAATEARLGVRLPALLRQLYAIADGGFVGDLYVPLKPDPAPLWGDWRGAFAIDYSSLAPLDQLRTVAAHYAEFCDDPEDVPEHAERRVILQARYGDMTLLDYSGGPEPHVQIVDFDKRRGEQLDIEFEDFERFFAALRRRPR